MTPEVSAIIIAMPDGSTARMQIVVRATRGSFAPVAAKSAGYRLKRGVWTLDLTDQRIEQEIARTAGLTPNNGWVRE